MGVHHNSKPRDWAKRETLVEAYGSWLKEFSWDVFGTLTFRHPQSRAAANREFVAWLSQPRREAGTSAFRYVRVAEFGPSGGHLHFHFLLGGLKTVSNADILRWCERWRKTQGIPVAGKFDPSKGGIFYLLKTLLPDADFDIEIEIPRANKPQGGQQGE